MDSLRAIGPMNCVMAGIFGSIMRVKKWERYETLCQLLYLTRCSPGILPHTPTTSLRRPAWLIS